MMNEQENLLAAETEEPEVPRKVGLPRFFELLGRDLWSFFRASFLCGLGWLPGFALLAFGLMIKNLLFCLVGGALAGLVGAPFLCGLLDTILRALRDEPGYWWHTYKMAWKQNWKQSLVPGLVFGVFFGLWAGMLFTAAEMDGVPTSVWICLIVGLFLGLGFFGYSFLQIPLVDLPLGQRVKNAALMFLGFFPRTLAATVVTGAYWAVMLLYLPYTLLVLLALGWWLPCLVSSMILYPGLDRVFGLERTLRERRNAEIDARMAAAAPVFDTKDEQP